MAQILVILLGCKWMKQSQGVFNDQKCPFSYTHYKLREYLTKICRHFSRISWYSFCPMGLYHLLDGITNLKYKLLYFLTPNITNSKRKALALNRDRCCHLVICLHLLFYFIPFWQEFQFRSVCRFLTQNQNLDFVVFKYEFNEALSPTRWQYQSQV